MISYVVSREDTEKSQINQDNNITIEMEEILTAIDWWANGTQVPKTGGKKIDMDMILNTDKVLGKQ